MNTSPNTTLSSKQATSLIKRRWFQLALIPVVAGAGLVAYGAWFLTKPATNTGAIFEVAQGPLAITVSEAGTIQNRDLKIVSSELEGRSQIVTLIPEGTMVEKGDLLVKLDSSALEDQRTQEQISVMEAEAAFIGAQQNAAITKSQGESDVEKADLDYKFAVLDLKKYQEGDYPQSLDQAKNDITVAKAQLSQAQKKVNDSRELEKEGYITKTELEGDELDATTKELNLQMAVEKMKLLEDFVKGRTVEQLTSNVQQTQASLERTKRKASANDVQAAATLKAKESNFTREKAKLEKIERQISKCVITAPVAGMAVYATTAHPQRNVDPLAEGQDIRERQELIYLPTTASMRADIKVHESSLTKVHVGLPVQVTVDAVPGKVFTGKVGKIALLPDNSNWMNPDLKVYNTEIWIDGDAQGLRAGMSCMTELIVAQYEDAVYVPVHTVVRDRDEKTCVYVVSGEGKLEKRIVEIGLDNNRMVHIMSGLKKGERVTEKPDLAEGSTPGTTGQGQGTTIKPAAKEATPEQGAAQPTTKTAEPTAKATDAQPEGGKTKMTPEEAQKRLDSMTPEQKAEAMKRRAARAASRGGAAGQGQGQ